MYASEFAVNARVSAGFTRLALEEPVAAAAAFRSALDEAPSHARASLGLRMALACQGDFVESEAMRVATEQAIAELIRGERPDEASLVAAGQEIVDGRADAAIARLDQLLSDAPPGRTGWIIPVDPMLAGLRSTSGLTELLAKLAARAA